MYEVVLATTGDIDYDFIAFHFILWCSSFLWCGGGNNDPAGWEGDGGFFNHSLLSESATLSCWDLRSLVPVWIILWLGKPTSTALLVLGHQVFSTLASVHVGTSCWSP